MLQGNSYEAEKWVEDRTNTVRHSVARYQRPATGQTDEATESLGFPRVERTSRQLLAWWLPLAFAASGAAGLLLGWW